jgi:hypothetical protein
MHTLRLVVGTVLIKAGFALIPAEVKDMVRGMILYHVPGAMTEAEKADVRAAKAAYTRSR